MLMKSYEIVSRQTMTEHSNATRWCGDMATQEKTRKDKKSELVLEVWKAHEVNSPQNSLAGRKENFLS